MRVTKAQAKILETAIEKWEASTVITSEISQKMRESIQVAGFDWKRLAKYSFWFSVLCLAIAVGAIIDDKLLEALLIRIFGNIVRGYCVIFALLSVGLFPLGIYLTRTKPESIFRNQAVFFLGVLSIAASITFLAAELQLEHSSLFFLLASALYAFLGFMLYSKLIWIFALVTLGCWFGAETGYISGWGVYYLGMNYPLRFVLFGTVLSGLSLTFRFGGWKQNFYAPTLKVGLLYLFIALWLLSIFGNYGDIEVWEKTSQFELLHWSILFGFVAILAIFLGLRYEEKIVRKFGLTFLFINMYTRFFEYFWDHLHKAIFFTILAISFWFIGSRAENIWGFKIGRDNTREIEMEED